MAKSKKMNEKNVGFNWTIEFSYQHLKKEFFKMTIFNYNFNFLQTSVCHQHCKTDQDQVMYIGTGISAPLV